MSQPQAKSQFAMSNGSCSVAGFRAADGEKPLKGGAEKVARILPGMHGRLTKGALPARLAVISLHVASFSAVIAQEPPYPPSQTITAMTWHWDTYKTAAIGSDLWPVTWGPDDHLYLAWGDGGGFGGSDSDGRVSLGFARIEGRPENFRGFNINGGKHAARPASFPKEGKTGALLFDQGVLYATINLQDGKWPDVNHVLAWSSNNAASWIKNDWLFARGQDTFEPAKFLNFGKNDSGVPASLSGYIYLYGVKQDPQRQGNESLYLVRARRERIRRRDAFEFFSGLDIHGQPAWNPQFNLAQPVFNDTNGVAPAGMVYDPGLKLFLLTAFHNGPGQLGAFEARHPWGPWSTVAYYAAWGGMGMAGEGLSCEFPQKWMSADGATLWAIFSVYGEGAKEGIKAHDRFNLIKVTLSVVRSNQPR